MTNKINGIDVSECEFLECGMCNAQRNCDGYTGIECKYDNENCYYRQLKRLQQELDIKEKMLDKFMIGSGETLEKLKKENEKLKEDLKGETEQAQKWYQLETDKHFLALKFCKALEEIRKEANRLLYELNPIYGYNNSNYFEILAKYVLAKTKEVLDDRN